jgi:hypothetical protein
LSIAYCPKCGEKIEANEKYCLNCGFNLEELRLALKIARKAEPLLLTPKGPMISLIITFFAIWVGIITAFEAIYDLSLQSLNKYEPRIFWDMLIALLMFIAIFFCILAFGMSYQRAVKRKKELQKLVQG